MLTKLRWTVLGLLIVLPVIGGIVGIKALQFRAMGAAAAQMASCPLSSRQRV